MKGQIKRLLPHSCGFIESFVGPDHFFHENDLVDACDFDELEEGTAVTFTSTTGQRGLRATQVALLDGPDRRRDCRRDRVADIDALFLDRTLRCQDCGLAFVWSASAQGHLAHHCGPPKYCRTCAPSHKAGAAAPAEPRE